MNLPLSSLNKRSWAIGGALLIAILFVAAGYYGPILLSSSSASAESTQASLASYAAKDTDGDGLPDWQETLYGSDPTNPHSIDPTLTDKEAVDKGLVTPKFASAAIATTTPVSASNIPGPAAAPGSVTDTFAKTFLSTYFASGNADAITSGDPSAIVDQLSGNLSGAFASKFNSSYGAANLQISTIATPTSYVNGIEAVFEANTGTADLSSLVDAYVSNNDPKARVQLVALAALYRRTEAALAGVPVPSPLAAAHLSLVQSYDLAAQATSAIANYASDPLATVGALSVFKAIEATIPVDLQAAENSLGGTPAAGAPGSLIAQIIASYQTTTP